MSKAGPKVAGDVLSTEERRDFLVKIYEERAEFLIRNELDLRLYTQDNLIIKDPKTSGMITQKIQVIEGTIDRVKRTMELIKKELLELDKNEKLPN